jgi:hypothetical protein
VTENQGFPRCQALPDITRESSAVQLDMPAHDSAPIVAYFTDRDTADQCLRELRRSGILNEQIGVNTLSSTVLTPANDPDVNRATNQEHTGSDIQDFTHSDDRPGTKSNFPTPNSAQFNGNMEAEEYEDPDQGVMVSVSVEPAKREDVRNLLHHFGARLSDWPASNDKVA